MIIILNLDLVNNLFNNLKENKFVQNFISELSNCLENNSNTLSNNYSFHNLLSDDLTIYNNKIISKYKNEMLIERNNILQNYAKNTKGQGDMFYIYNINENNSYILSNCSSNSSEVITMEIEDLPKSSNLGSILRKQGDKFELDSETTQLANNEIDLMIKEKIDEQSEYLDSVRIDGHTYEVNEKYSGRIWLYDLDNNVSSRLEGIEEVNFPINLYETAKEGDLFIYKNGEYQLK